MDNGKLLTVREAAVSLGLSVACIRSWVAQRRIGYVKLGRAVRIPASEITRLFDSGYIPVKHDWARR